MPRHPIDQKYLARRLKVYVAKHRIIWRFNLALRRNRQNPKRERPRGTMAKRVVTQDVADVASKLLEAENRKLAESQAKFQKDFEAREAKFNADLERLAPHKLTGHANSVSDGRWLLARKCWAWFTAYREG
jgi:hypothetical protein